MLGGIGGRRRKGQQRIWCLDSITDSMDMSLGELRELVMDREAWRAEIQCCNSWGCKQSDTTEWLNWTEVKNQCFWTVVLEHTIHSPLENKEIKLVSLKGNQPWIFSGKTDAEAEVPIFWPPDANNWLFGKDSGAGKHWRQKEKRDQMIICLDGIIDSMDMNLGKFQEMVRDRKAWHAAVHEVTKSQRWLSNWTKIT